MQTYWPDWQENTESCNNCRSECVKGKIGAIKQAPQLVQLLRLNLSEQPESTGSFSN